MSTVTHTPAYPAADLDACLAAGEHTSQRRHPAAECPSHPRRVVSVTNDPARPLAVEPRTATPEPVAPEAASAERGERITRTYTRAVLDLTGGRDPHRDRVQAASLICDVLAYADTLPGADAADVLDLALYHRTDLDGSPSPVTASTNGVAAVLAALGRRAPSAAATRDAATLDRIAALARESGDCGSDFIGDVCNLVAGTGRDVSADDDTPEPATQAGRTMGDLYG